MGQDLGLGRWAEPLRGEALGACPRLDENSHTACLRVGPICLDVTKYRHLHATRSLCSHTATCGRWLTHAGEHSPHTCSPISRSRGGGGRRRHPQLVTRGVFPSEEELTLTRENSIRRLHSHRSDPRSQVCVGGPLLPRSTALPGPGH